MSGSLQPRVKTWVTTEDLTYSDLNAEFDNVLAAMRPSLIDDYSANATEMRVQTDPGESGTESLSTTLAGEIARLRYAIYEMKGSGTYWYETSSYTLSSLGAAVGGGLPNNRLVSGRVRSLSNQSVGLVPHGTARTVTLKGASTNFIYVIAGTSYTITTDLTLTSLTLPPSTNNTCLVNDAGLTGTSSSKYIGENGSTLTVDAMGSSVSALVGKLAGFKVGAEYFIARVASSTSLSHIRRGLFFDSADAPLPRVVISDNDTITLMKLSWIYGTTSSALTVGYTEPRVSDVEPLSPATGDYWFDVSANVWKIYNATQWDTANATLIGVCLQDASYTIAARTFDYFKAHSATNTVGVEYYDATEVRSRSVSERITVNGTLLNYAPDHIRWDIDTDLDTGLTEAANTLYFLYVTENAASVISTIAPHDMPERLGLYHPHQMWRCVGQVYNNSASDFENVISYDDVSEKNYALSHRVSGSALTVTLHAPPHALFKVKSATATNSLSDTAAILPDTQLIVSSGSTLGTAASTFTFTVTAANATIGTTYTNNSQTFTVTATIAGTTTLICYGTGAPAASGTLTKVLGSGDSTITFSAVTSAAESTLLFYGVGHAKRLELGVSQAPHLDGSVIATVTAEGGAGAASSATLLYATAARTSASLKLFYKVRSSQAAAGTWASTFAALYKYPFTHTYAQSVLSSTTITVPAGQLTASIYGSGGGGGGGAGGGGTSGTQSGGGGGGGGGAPLFRVNQAVTPNDTLTITIGAGSAGGTGVNTFPGNDGTTGLSTIINGSDFVLSFIGGGGGGGGGSRPADDAKIGLSSIGAGGEVYYSLTTGSGAGGGGGGSRGIGGAGKAALTAGNSILNQTGQSGSSGSGGGGGGAGLHTSLWGLGGVGGASDEWPVGAAAGAGTAAGGGGGGGSAWGVGGAGGAGTANSATAGGTAAANSGAGGGGGGGDGSTTNGPGGAGGAGGSGKVIFYWSLS